MEGYLESTKEALDEIRSNGYAVASIETDSKVHRFKIDEKDVKKSGFYICYQNFSEKTGQPFLVVVYGSWRDGETKTLCTLKGVQSSQDKKNIKAKIEEMKRKEAAAREREYREVADEVKAIWEGLFPAGESKYLEKKQIAQIQNLGVRFDKSGTIYIPVRDSDGRLWSFQKIQWDGSKWFHSGGRVRGCSHTIGDVTQSDDIYITEGFATAATIYHATGKPVIVSFTASNLVEVAKDYKQRFPSKSFIVCGDDDRWTTKPDGTPWNPGRERAEEAARYTVGKAVFPEFKDLDGRPTDFNDLHLREGIKAVIEQLSSIEVERTYLSALGFKEKEYFFTSSANQQIVSIHKFSKIDFLNLMPLEYWETVFPGAGSAKVDWDSAATSLMESARAKGIFESHNIRGAGVWEDGKRIVVNMGDHLIVDGRRMELGEIKSRYFYTLGIKMPGLHPEPLTIEECEVLTNACHSFKWKKEDFGYLLAGSLVTTRVCGALPIRPHLWLTGSRGSGKTTLFNRLIYPVIGEPLIFAGGSSTEAGIRQEVCANAVPILFDEFENLGGKSADNIQSVLDLMRLAWSETRASIIKGGSGGVATSYRARFAAIVTSIRQVSMNDADKSRFATIELAEHGNDQIHWKELESYLNQIDMEFGNRLFARTIKMVPVILENFKTMKRVMNKASINQRFGDQYGMLFAGYATLIQDEPMDDSQALVFLEKVTLTEEREEAEVADHHQALQHLLTTSHQYESGGHRHTCSIGSMIEHCFKSGDSPLQGAAERSALRNLGIRVDSEFVMIASRHAAQEKLVWRGTHWSKSWAATLARLDDARGNINQRIEGKQTKCVMVPKRHFTG